MSSFSSPQSHGGVGVAYSQPASHTICAITKTLYMMNIVKRTVVFRSMGMPPVNQLKDAIIIKGLCRINNYFNMGKRAELKPIHASQYV
jgi:hypothetical protein